MDAIEHRSVEEIRTKISSTALLLISVFMLGCAQSGRPGPAPALGGTTWQLVRFQGSDDNEVAPERRDLYTIAFGAGGSLNVRFDCNRGRGTWKSPEASQLEFGPLALTRAMCPSQSLHDLMVRQWPFVRSYLVRQGHLFISLQADGGTFEFEPAP